MSKVESTCLDNLPRKKLKLTSAAGETGSSAVISLSSIQKMEENGSNGEETAAQQEKTTSSIDEGLYSRQLYVLGREAMERMSKSRVLISGIGGLGVEIAKNLILGGVKCVTLHDQKNTKWGDITTQFYLHPQDVNKNRAEQSLEQLSQLNPYTTVEVKKGELNEEFIKDFNVVVLADGAETEEKLVKLSGFCHAKKIAFILAETRGVFSRLFCDFSTDFIVVDNNGEQPVSAMIAGITKDGNGVVSCLDETRHGLEDGDFVTFSEVVGMEELNGGQFEIKVTGPYTFTIGDTTGFSDYKRGGIVKQLKMPKKIQFLPYEEARRTPEFVVPDFAKFESQAQLHLGFQSLDKYVSENGRFPKPWDVEDATAFLDLARMVNQTLGDVQVVQLDEKLLKLLAAVSSGNTCPMNGFLGGVAAQEVMKACSGKFNPIHQWLYFDAVECLPQFYKEDPFDAIDMSDFEGAGSRYEAQISVFGKKFQEKLANLKYFIVGAGAIGCELLKNFAMLGVGTGDGKIIVTDMDLIERSNLNRQFLFRSKDIGQPKAKCAAKAVKMMNPDVNIEFQENRVGPETEKVYDDDFFEQLDGVANALDNVEARLYMDRRCLYYRKPLLESGTLGTKGNTQVVVPFLTESYGSSQDPPEKSIPICTLRNFPNAIEHTLHWARELFETIFKQAAETAAQFLRDPKYLERALQMPGTQQMEVLESVKKALVERPVTILDCVRWARLLWEENFNNNIQQLLFNFPPDQTTSSGHLFWSPPKRCPTAMKYSRDDLVSNEFIFSAANLRAKMYGIPTQPDREFVADLAAATEVPVFHPSSGVRIALADTDQEAQHQMSAIVGAGTGSCLGMDEIKKLIPTGPKLIITPIEFEKDDDTNFHMEFIVAASNSRAINYGIAPADALQSKLIAGKIIPAIATTTSVVSGLVSLELIKIAHGYAEEKNVTKFKNAFLNLALPVFTFSAPMEAPKKKYYETEWTLWDRFEVEGEMTLQQLLDHFKDKYALEITMLSQGVCMLYAFFLAEDKKDERLALPLCEVVRRASKRRLEPHVQYFVLEPCCISNDGEDVEVPCIRYKIPLARQLP